MSFTRSLALFLIDVLASGGSALASCTAAPREITPFGAQSQTHPMPNLSPTLSSQLPGLTALEGVLQMSGHPDSQIVFYDTTSNESDPHPMAAIIERGRVQTTAELDSLTKGRGGFTRFLSACAFRFGSSGEKVAFAVSNGFVRLALTLARRLFTS